MCNFNVIACGCISQLADQFVQAFVHDRHVAGADVEEFIQAAEGDGEGLEDSLENSATCLPLLHQESSSRRSSKQDHAHAILSPNKLGPMVAPTHRQVRTEAMLPVDQTWSVPSCVVPAVPYPRQHHCAWHEHSGG